MIQFVCENTWLFYMTIVILTAMCIKMMVFSKRVPCGLAECRTNLLPPSPDCSLLDREIRFFHPYQFTGHHMFIRTWFLGFTNADQGLSPLQQLTHKGGTYRIQYKSVIANDLVAVKYRVIQNDCQCFNNLSHTVHLR
jgi:hypothetical protein